MIAVTATGGLGGRVARESRRPSGHPEWEIDGWVTAYAAIAAGEPEAVSDTVSRITGRRPRSLAEFLRENPGSYAHLTVPQTSGGPA